MKSICFLVKIACCMALCLNFAGADSIQLRNGRHLQGKYIGGTTSTIGFMSGANVEYFLTSDVLVLIFDNGGDSTMRGPSPMKQLTPRQTGREAQTRLRRASAPDHARLVRKPTAGALTQVNAAGDVALR